MKKNLLHLGLFGVFLMLGIIASAQPGVSGLSMDASSPNYSTNDDLTATYTTSGAVESATTWYVDGTPLARVFFPFEAGGTDPDIALLDYSGRHNDLTTSGDPATTPVWNATAGHNGTGAFTFDGNDYLDGGTNFPRNSSYTKTAWVYITVADGYKNIISGYLNADRNHGFKVNPNGRLTAGHSFGSFYVSTPDSLFNDVWYHTAVTFDFESGLMVLYLDGVEVARDIVPESNRSVTDDGLLIGAKTFDFFWTGNIDDAAVYSRALTPEQIQAVYTDRMDLILSKETRGGERWRVRVTPFSETEVGTSRMTADQTLQAPVVSAVALAASSPGNLSTDDLTTTYTSNASVTETTTAWFRDGTPDALLNLPFEGIEEALNDYSGNGNHATMIGNMLDDPDWDATAGHNGSGAFVFDGNDEMEAGDIFPLNSSYTKTAWIYNTGIFFGNIMSSDLHDVNNHTLRVSVDGHMTAGHDFGNNTVRDPDAMSLDTWYFVAVTYDYDTRVMRLYRDGLQVHQATVPTIYQDVVDPSLLIGSMNYQYNWTGVIDEPKLFSRALSPHQINVMFSGDDEIVSEETIGGEEWHAEVTPFASSDAGTTVASNAVLIHSVVVSDISDQSILEGASFSSIDLDNYVDVYEFTPADLVWTSRGSSELIVAIDAVSHVLTVTIPDPDWYGSEVLTIAATNPNGDADSTEVTYTIQNVNDAPVLAIIGGQQTDEDTPLTGLVVAFTDPDPTDTHTISILSSDPNVTYTDLSGSTDGSTYTLVPAADWNGSTQITVRVTDNGTSPMNDFEVYTLVVNDVNDAPVLTAIGDQSTDEDTNLTGRSVVFTDADADLHTITVDSDDANVTIENLTGHINGSMYDLVPAADWNGTAEITVRVTDDGTGALSDFETYTLTVNPINDEPVLTDIGAQSTDEDMDLTGLPVVFTDPDGGDAHTITVVSSEANVSMANLSAHISGSTYDLVATPNWNGTAQITVRVTDDGTGALSDFETYTLTIDALNDAPVIVEIGDQNVDEDDVFRGIPVTFTDAEPFDTHTITVTSDESSITVANLNGNVSGSTYTLVPTTNWSGTAQITVTVTEVGSGGLSDVEVYTLTVNNINDDPTALEISNNTVEERVAIGTIVGQFMTTDIDMDDIHVYTFILDGGVNDVDNDAFTIDGDSLKTNVELDFEVQSSYSILVQSDDGAGGTISQSFTITVGDLNETGVEDIYNSPVFNVYPVPAIDHVTVEVENPDNKELLLEIYSNSGRLVHAEPIFSKSRIDLTGFSDGMYILRIKGEQVFGTRKLIVKDR